MYKIDRLILAIHTDNLIKQYKGRKVVDQVSISVKQGEIVGLLGPNGAGKTTTFYMVVGLIAPDEGRVFLNDEDITKLPMYKRAQMGLGYLPQEASVFRKLSVEDNIMAILEMTKLTKAERDYKLDSLLDEFNLHQVRKNNGDSLSGGERRRTEIARALAAEPELLLLDEPFAGLGSSEIDAISSLIRKLHAEKLLTILLIEHKLREFMQLVSRVIALDFGEVIAEGSPAEIVAHPRVIEAYIGKQTEMAVHYAA